MKRNEKVRWIEGNGRDLYINFILSISRQKVKCTPICYVNPMLKVFRCKKYCDTLIRTRVFEGKVRGWKCWKGRNRSSGWDLEKRRWVAKLEKAASSGIRSRQETCYPPPTKNNITSFLFLSCEDHFLLSSLPALVLYNTLLSFSEGIFCRSIFKCFELVV